MTQTIMFPTLCFGCKAERTGLTEGIALYACGTAIGVQDGRVKARRTQRCIDSHCLPPGLKMSADGIISGTPTKEGAYGPIIVGPKDLT